MKLRKIKKYLGLCQCKGCMKKFDSSVLILDYQLKWYRAFLCDYHATEAIQDPFLEV